MRKFIGLIVLTGILLSSCSEFHKVMKSDDYQLKYKKAQELYTEQEFGRALELLESIRPIYRGTEHAPRIDYLIANSYFKQGQYILAGYHFRNLAQTFPNSAYTREADYMSAYCYYLESPRYSLDQSSTKKAIEAFQTYMRKYPQSNKIEECNKYIDEMRGKLAKKAYKSSKFYLELGDYKAAAVALRNTLNNFPASKYREDLLFNILKANFLLAENSVESKQQERYKQTIKSYYPLVDEYPESPHIEKAKSYFSKSQEALKNMKEEQLTSNY